MRTANRNAYPLSRWIIGHQVFIGLIQTLTVSLTQFENELLNGDLSGAETSLNRASELMKASIQAMRFAADFHKTQYQEVVRPSLPEKFTGLDALDHKLMVQKVRGFQTTFASLPASLEPAVRRLRTTVADAYDAHALVCEKFVGREMSLRQNPNETAAPEVLINFKKMRLSPFGDLPNLNRASK